MCWDKVSPYIDIDVLRQSISSYCHIDFFGGRKSGERNQGRDKQWGERKRKFRSRQTSWSIDIIIIIKSDKEVSQI